MDMMMSWFEDFNLVLKVLKPEVFSFDLDADSVRPLTAFDLLKGWSESGCGVDYQGSRA